MKKRIPILGGTAEGDIFDVSIQQTLNLSASIRSPGAKESFVLESAPGLVQLSGAGDGGVRTPQMVSWRSPASKKLGMYGVFGTKAVAVEAGLGSVDIGTLSGPAISRVRVARGRTHLLFVDGERGYTYDGTTFAEISDLDFPSVLGGAKPTHCAYLDGFFIVNNAASDSFFISAFEDPTAWNALDFEAAGASPDLALALVVNQSQLWVVGDETAQAFYNSGNSQFPFSANIPATVELGILSPQSIAKSSDGIYYLAGTPAGGRMVVRIGAGQAGPVTASEQSDTLEALTDAELAAAYGFVYQQGNQQFYCLQIAEDRPSLVYNITAGQWESRSLGESEAWRAGGAGLYEGRPHVGSRLAPVIYELRSDNYQDAGVDMVRRRRTAIMHSDGNLIEWLELVVDCGSGVGRVTAPGQDPTIRLRYSDDHGRSWSSALTEPLGRAGEYQRRAVFRRLGQSRHRVFELEFSDPVPVTVIAAYARAEVLLD